jgi:glycosyltransferase involved in cell wall biosynthesis
MIDNCSSAVESYSLDIMSNTTKSSGMRSVIVAFYNVFPPTSGAAAVSFNTAKYMTGERFLFHLDRLPSEFELEKGFRVMAFPCRTENHLTKVFDLLQAMPRMAHTISRLKPDVIILEGASWAVYYWLLFRLLNILRIKTRVVYHAHNVEYLLRLQRNSRPVAWLTRYAERALLRRCFLSTAVSVVDAGHFERLYKSRPSILPNGVDLDKFNRVTPSEIRAIRAKYDLPRQTVLFMGLTAFPPNQEAIRFLAQDVFHRVVQNRPKAKLAIIGGEVDMRRDWLINPGSIPYDEVPAFIKACDLCVAPIFSGSGTRLKILEYMAARKPVVATAKGAEGLNVEDGKNILLAEGAVAFSNKLMTLLQDTQLRTRLGEEGFLVAKAFYSWPSILHKLCQKLSPAAGKNRSQRVG